jgi:mRNA interferase RelE/StbE
MKFRVKISKKVEKSLSGIAKDDMRRILDSIRELEEPFSIPYEKLRGSQDIYRIRVGDFRVIYYVDKEEKVALVLRVELRKRAYRRI